MRAVPARIAIVLLLAVSPVFAQPPAPARARVEIEIEFANSELPRNVSLFTAIGEAANRGGDAALDKAFGRPEGPGTAHVTTRLARLWFVNLPIAALVTTASHDVGHFARLNEAVPGRNSVRVTHWPWPVPLVGTVEWNSAEIVDPFANAAAFGGGEQGSMLLRNRMVDKIYAADRADYFDWTLVGYAALDFPVYAWTDLRASHFKNDRSFWETDPADFRNYVSTQAEIAGPLSMAALRHYGRQIRTSAFLNLADFALWCAIAQTARYVATGEHSTTNPAIQIGRLRVVPGAYSNLSSLGLERGVDVRVVSSSYLTHINLRRTSVASRGERWGLGVGVRSRRESVYRPQAQFDVWRRLADERGFRIEGGLRHRFREGIQPFEAGFSIGYKSEGYLVDAPYRSGLLGAVNASVRF